MSVFKLVLHGGGEEKEGEAGEVMLINKIAFYCSTSAHNHCIYVLSLSCRCGKLKRLILNNNQLVTIPDAHYFLTDLEVYFYYVIVSNT